MSIRDEVAGDKTPAAMMKEIEWLRKEVERLQSQAATDPLTSVGNRRAMEENLKVLLDRGKRYGERFSVSMVDIDHFKKFNDTRGHPAGDLAIKTVAEALSVDNRDSDVVYRYGGEEFLVVLPGQGSWQAVIAMERRRGNIEKDGIVTVSAGVAQYRECDDIETLLSRADRALYTAKSSGRNNVKMEKCE